MEAEGARRDKLKDLDRAEQECLKDATYSPEIMKGYRESELQKIQKEYGLSREEAEISFERRKVYGDPRDNHRGISMAWAGLLQPHWQAIRDMVPIPEHTVALLMASLKMNRMRMVYHKDNFDDLRVYVGFAQAWQQTWTGPGLA